MKLKVTIIVILCLSSLLMLMTQSKSSLGVDQWVQVNVNGFGNPATQYATAMETFNGYLFVGTGTNLAQVWRTIDGLSWEQVVQSGFGEPNQAVVSMASFDGYIYVGTQNNIVGCQIWRSPTGDSNDWEKVVTDGFVGDSGVISVYTMEVFKGHLYAGTGGGVGHALSLWRTNDGVSWTAITTDGFGDSQNIRLTSVVVFGDYLYVGTSNEAEGGEVWRSMTGDPGSWELVSHGGFGDLQNWWIYEAVVFQSNMYVAVARGPWSPGAIWRTADGTSWEQVTANGFGDPDNNEIRHLIVFDGKLYAGTRTNNGAEVWKSPDGVSWARSNEKGFGDQNNRYVTSTEVFRGSLYVGTWNQVEGCEVWAFTQKVQASVNIDPDTLNLKSNGNWITAYITLPEGYSVEDIVLETVKVNGISAAWSDIQNGVYMAKFERATVQTYLTNEPDYESAPKFYDITLPVTGGLTDGTVFEGTDTITVIKK